MSDGNNVVTQQSHMQQTFQVAFEDEGLFEKIIDLFPYPIQIYDANGTSVMVNQALLNNHNLKDPFLIVGRYNVFNDPLVVKYGIIEDIKRVFKGDSIQLNNIKLPMDELIEFYGIEGLDFDALYQDITAFPILDSQKKVKYVVAMMIEKKIYRGKTEIVKAKEYFDLNWKEPFDINDVAQRVGLSKSHFTRLFKKYEACTPHDYYTKLKIEKIKEKLLDKSMSISQAFSVCGIDYNGHYAKVFKTKTKLTPSEFRNINT